VLIFGVCGNACSGKDSVAEILERDFGFAHISTSKLVRDEVLNERKKETRENQTFVANSTRKEYGSDYFVKEAIRIGVNGSWSSENLVLSGIYCVGEARFLLSQNNAFLIGVSGPDVKDRFERLKSRIAGKQDHMTYEQFRERDLKENSGKHDWEPNVEQVMRLANVIIDNQGTFEEFKSKVHAEVKLITGLSPFRTDPHWDSSSKNGLKSLDQINENVALETRYEAFRFIADYFAVGNSLSPMEKALAPLISPSHAVNHIGNQIGQIIVETFMESDPYTALGKFRDLKPRTIQEEMILLVNDTEFLNCHQALSSSLEHMKDQIYDASVKNIKQIEINDEVQFNQRESRSVDAMISNGVRIRISSDAITLLERERESQKNGMIPLIEILKNEKILDVSGFQDSKISHAIHDTIDHAWLFWMLRERGLFEKYLGLFDSIGNPEATDMYKREGEVVASIGFGVRYWANIEAGFIPKVSISEIAERFESYFDLGELDDLHLDSYRKVRELVKHPLQREAQSLAFAFSNYLTELDEQRRKHGKIKRKDTRTKKILGELDPWSPDYLSFFVEAHNLLLNSKNRHRNTLHLVHLLFEDYLNRNDSLEGGTLILHMNTVLNEWTGLSRDGEASFSPLMRLSIPPERINWMLANPGFTAFKDQVV
jgi:dephospho-CoA kinase